MTQIIKKYHKKHKTFLYFLIYIFALRPKMPCMGNVYPTKYCSQTINNFICEEFFPGIKRAKKQHELLEYIQLNLIFFECNQFLLYIVIFVNYTFMVYILNKKNFEILKNSGLHITLKNKVENKGFKISQKSLIFSLSSKLKLMRVDFSIRVLENIIRNTTMTLA